MKRAYIKALANYLPEKVLSNEYFEKYLDTSDEWISIRTGIKTRHIAREDETTFDMAISVIENLKKQNVDINNIDAIIVPTTTKDYITPSTAGLIQNYLNIKNCFTFDLSAACSGYVYSLNTATSLIESGMCENVLVVAVEKLSKDVNFDDRNTAILFGDAASAFILSSTDEDKGVLEMHMKSEVREDIINIKSSGTAYPVTPTSIEKREHCIYMEGSEVFKIAVTEFCNSIDYIIKKHGINLEDINVFIPHQANLRIIQSVAKRSNFNFENIKLILDKYGNTSAASIGLSLTETVQSGKIKKGDYVLLTAFGGGLTWGSTLIRW